MDGQARAGVNGAGSGNRDSAATGRAPISEARPSSRWERAREREREREWHVVEVGVPEGKASKQAHEKDDSARSGFVCPLRLQTHSLTQNGLRTFAVSCNNYRSRCEEQRKTSTTGAVTPPAED